MTDLLLNVCESSFLHLFICLPAGDDASDSEEHRSPSQQEEDSDCPRDSGCFIPSECSDTKEDTDQVTDEVDA